MKTINPKQSYKAGDKVWIDLGSFRMTTWIDRIYREKGDTVVDTRDGHRVYLRQILRKADGWGRIGE